MSDTKKTNEYGAQSIRIIEGLEAVRKRPAMYIGSTGLQGVHHLVYEVVDNSVDEALAGHAHKIKVMLNADGSCSVEDDGRGIPVEMHESENISAAEVVLTKLHAGGKFDKDSYKYSGGLHGVGISVVNALSSDLYLEVYKHGKIYAQSYKKGHPQGPLSVIGNTTKRGTYIRFTPDEEIFQETTTFRFDTLSARLRELAFLNKKLRIIIEDKRSDKSHDFYFEGGIKSFVEHVNTKKSPLFPDVIYCEKEDEKYVLEIALQYNDGYGEQLYSFVNNINTVEGGTHVTGFKSALTKACNKKAQAFKMLKNEGNFSSEDVREGLVVVISIKVPEPQFEGQTKTKLGNSEIKWLVDSWMMQCLDTYFEEHPHIAKKILQKAEVARNAREAARKARELTRRKTVLESTVLPGKLADCSHEDPSKTEIFIVEGDSAGGSAKQGRDRYTQAILPLKGKILNVEKSRLDKILSNDEIKSLIAAIGAGIGKDFDVEKARYHKVILMTDADVDGSHIRTLLLTFFYRYMKPLIEKGYLYIAQPPLFKVKIGKKEQYVKDQKTLTQFLLEWVYEHAELTIDGRLMSGDEWNTLVTKYQAYALSLQDMSERFNLSFNNCQKLIEFIDSAELNDQHIDHLIDKLGSYFAPEYTVSMINKQSANDESDISGAVEFKTDTHAWHVPIEFFFSSDVHELVDLYQSIPELHNQWTLQIKGKDKKISSSGIIEFMKSVDRISKSFINIQRYKGLGEMNPEQLWQTSMDPQSRNLLQVSIGDALHADEWFNTLMGSDVSGRKEFIEHNGRFVKNLDV
jgi:DNA gyrase subunit B